MTLLTILGDTEILCSFKLILEGKSGKGTPESSRLKFFEKFSANIFALSDAEDNTSGPLNRRGIADLPLLRTPWTNGALNKGNLPKVTRAKFLENNRLFCFINICRFGSFKNSFATITSLSEQTSWFFIFDGIFFKDVIFDFNFNFYRTLLLLQILKKILLPFSWSVHYYLICIVM